MGTLQDEKEYNNAWLEQEERLVWWKRKNQKPDFWLIGILLLIILLYSII